MYYLFCGTVPVPVSMQDRRHGSVSCGLYKEVLRQRGRWPRFGPVCYNTTMIPCSHLLSQRDAYTALPTRTSCTICFVGQYRSPDHRYDVTRGAVTVVEVRGINYIHLVQYRGFANSGLLHKLRKQETRLSWSVANTSRSYQTNCV